MPAEFLPTRQSQVYQIFAANSHVGKTVLATGLCRAAAILANQCDRNVFYLKPIQMGYPIRSDERYVQNYNFNLLRSSTLFTYQDPVSPHIATENPPQDNFVLAEVKQQILNYVGQRKGKASYTFLETTGGVHTPVMSGTPQVDFYRPFRLPTLLVGDSSLNGISTTLTSFESLYIRGYDIPFIFFFDHPTFKNHMLVDDRVKPFGSEVITIPMPPKFLQDTVLDRESMFEYYSLLDECLVPVIRKISFKHGERFDKLEVMTELSRETFWWPFTQHETVTDVNLIDSAHHDYFTTYKKNAQGKMVPKEMFDSIASWWTQGLGHGNPHLTLSSAYAAGRYGHVIFPESTNEPALALALKVLDKDRWASRVFFSDDGSTAIEVALKMALKATSVRYKLNAAEPIEALGIFGAYHGDTIGALDATSTSVYNEQVQWYEPKGHFLMPPSVHISHGRVYVRVPSAMFPFQEIQQERLYYDSLSEIYSLEKNSNIRDCKLAKIYEDYIRSELQSLRAQRRLIGVLIIEPVLMGAGGMIFVDPMFQCILINIIRTEGSKLLYGIEENTEYSSEQDWQGLPVVFDEIFTGWYRLGRRSATEFLGVKPDIIAYAKALTGGLLPLALTVTKESIYNAFLSEKKTHCLLHGHSYTAHPMGCSVAKTAIEKMDEIADEKSGPWSSFRDAWNDVSIWSMWTPETVDRLSELECVESVMTLGSVLAVELKNDGSVGYSSPASENVSMKLRTAEFKNSFDGVMEQDINLICRPIGNVIYLMASHVTTNIGIRQCEQALLETLENF